MNRIEVNANESGRDVYIYIYIFTSCPSLVASSQAHSKTARTRYDERQEWQADSAAAAADAARGVTGCCRESVTADGDLPRISDTFSSVRPSVRHRTGVGRPASSRPGAGTNRLCAQKPRRAP